MVKKYSEQLLVPGLEESLENLKTEIAEEFGISFNAQPHQSAQKQIENKQNKKRS